MVAMIKEVAKRAGVSTATVSRILNGKGGHSSATVKSVEKIIEDLGFSGGHNSAVPECVGIIMLAYRDFLVSDYTSSLLTGVLEKLTNEGLIAQIIPITPNRLSFKYIQEIVQRYSLKGLIVQEFDQLYEVSAQLDTMDIPTVFIGNTEQRMKHSVATDSYAAGRDTAAYLWSLGHRRFGIITGRASDICQKTRLTGFCDFVREMGGDPEAVWKKSYNHVDDSLTSAATELTNMPSHPSAIFSTNSTLSLKLVMELKKRNLRVPEDISLISFEECGELENLETPMTVICQPTRLLGETAVRMLINLIRRRLTPEKEVLNCNLVVRDTSLPHKNN